MKFYVFLILTLFIWGCEKNLNITETNQIDLSPTKIQSFEAQNNSLIILGYQVSENPFPLHDVYYNVFIGDTIWNKITAIDRDCLISYNLEGEDVNGTMSFLNPVDTMNAQFGFIINESKYKEGTIVNKNIIFTDRLGFKYNFGIHLFIKEKDYQKSFIN